VWADSDEILLSRPISTYSPIPSTSAGYKTSAPTVLQPFYLGVEFYKRRLAELTDSYLPVLGGTQQIKLNISYVNLGRIDWNKITNGYPTDGLLSIAAANRPGGLFDILSFNSSALLGGNRTFTFFVVNPLMSSFAFNILNRIEDKRLGILVHPFLSSAEAYVCDGLTSPSSVTPDCMSPVYNRERRLGARRFETLFSVLPDLKYDASTTLSLFHTLGIHKIAIFRDAMVSGKSYSTLAYNEAITYAKELNLNPVVTGVLEVALPGQCPNATNCPPATLLASQNQLWPAGTTALSWANKLVQENVDAVLFIGTTGTSGAWSFAQLVTSMQQLDWTPKMLSWVGAFEKTSMQYFLPNGKADMYYTTGEIVWHKNLRGSNFQTQTTSTNFEIVEANATHAAPARFVEQFDRMFAPANQQPHPFWNGNVDGGTIPAITYNAMIQVQKLIEASASSRVQYILNSASKIDTPSVFHRLGFDAYGRARAFDVPVTQYTDSRATEETQIISPPNIGVQVVYPIPTWSERTFAPRFYSDPSEVIMVAITSCFILLILLVFVQVVAKVKHPIIRATTPSFAGLISLGGIFMLISNYFTTLHVNSVYCSAQVWFLTLGFTLMTSALFSKTYRIWKIFEVERLQVTRMKDMDLFKFVVAMVLVDVIINTIWQAADGMPAVLVVTDELRPKYNYYQCDYSSSAATGLMYVHIVLKASVVMGGIILTWAVRNVPSTFNDSLLLTACIYNITIIACFVIPIVATGLGGRKTTMMVRTLAIMFISLSTKLLLYAPKLYDISYGGDVAKLDGTRINNNTATHSHVTEENKGITKIKIVTASKSHGGAIKQEQSYLPNQSIETPPPPSPSL